MALKVSGKNLDVGQALRCRNESTVSGTHRKSHTLVMALRTANHDAVNIVYRRKDGHTGWVDPTLIEGGHV